MTAQAQPYKCREQPARQQEVTTTGAKRGAPRETRAPGKSGRSELTNEMRKTGPQGQTETDGWQKEKEGGAVEAGACMQTRACTRATSAGKCVGLDVSVRRTDEHTWRAVRHGGKRRRLHETGSGWQGTTTHHPAAGPSRRLKKVGAKRGPTSNLGRSRMKACHAATHECATWRHGMTCDNGLC